MKKKKLVIMKKKIRKGGSKVQKVCDGDDVSLSKGNEYLLRNSQMSIEDLM